MKRNVGTNKINALSEKVLLTNSIFKINPMSLGTALSNWFSFQKSKNVAVCDTSLSLYYLCATGLKYGNVFFFKEAIIFWTCHNSYTETYWSFIPLEVSIGSVQCSLLKVFEVKFDSKFKKKSVNLAWIYSMLQVGERSEIKQGYILIADISLT